MESREQGQAGLAQQRQDVVAGAAMKQEATEAMESREQGQAGLAPLRQDVVAGAAIRQEATEAMGSRGQGQAGLPVQPVEDLGCMGELLVHLLGEQAAGVGVGRRSEEAGGCWAVQAGEMLVWLSSLLAVWAGGQGNGRRLLGRRRGSEHRRRAGRGGAAVQQWWRRLRSWGHKQLCGTRRTRGGRSRGKGREVPGSRSMDPTERMQAACSRGSGSKGAGCPGTCGWKLMLVILLG